MVALILAITFLFSPPSVSLNWTSSARTNVKVQVEGEDEFIQRCAKSGLAVRYSYTARLCHDRSLWFDSCGEERLVVRTMRYDPISSRITSRTILSVMARMEQQKPQLHLKMPLTYLHRIDAFPLSFLGRKELRHHCRRERI